MFNSDDAEYLPPPLRKHVPNIVTSFYILKTCLDGSCFRLIFCHRAKCNNTIGNIQGNKLCTCADGSMETEKLVKETATTKLINLGERKYSASYDIPPSLVGFRQHGRETPGYSMRSIDRNPDVHSH